MDEARKDIERGLGELFDSLKIYEPYMKREMIEELVIEVCRKLYSISGECKRCSECCYQHELTYELGDIKRISEHLNMTAGEFRKKYLKWNGKKWIASESWPCAFYNDEEKGCTIYSVRPYVCKLFPAYSPAIIHNIPLIALAQYMNAPVEIDNCENDPTCFPVLKKRLEEIVKEKAFSIL